MLPNLAEAARLLAAAPETTEVSATVLLFQHILAAIIYSAVGLAAFGACFWIINKVTPFSLRKELEEDQNQAVATIVGAMIIGMAIIIAAAIHG
ncbi:MAG: DUF350 domain-containing protein [Planctomycetales bacterium]